MYSNKAQSKMGPGKGVQMMHGDKDEQGNANENLEVNNQDKYHSSHFN